MNNEEKILVLLEQMNGRLDKLEQDAAAVKEDVAVIREDAEVTRCATNTLLDWAEKAQLEVEIPL
ncbi:MAG TPA: hypothetical protein H9684_05890 [Firmicutes bacterium]|nr:hypothetical protein [Bacillota bacterium]